MTNRSKPWMTILPAGFTLLFLFFHALPQRLMLFSDIIPLFTLISVYYWCMFRPGLMPFWFLFLTGLLQDLVFGLPMGASSLVLIIFRILVVSQHRLFGKETFWGLWFWFSVLAALAFSGYWLIISIFAGHFMPVTAGLVQWILTLACYPMVHWVFTRIYRYLPKDSAAPVA